MGWMKIQELDLAVTLGQNAHTTSVKRSLRRGINEWRGEIIAASHNQILEPSQDLLFARQSIVLEGVVDSTAAGVEERG